MRTKKQISLSDAHIDEAARLFGVLADASRLVLVRALLDGPMTVSELIEMTDMKQGNISKHLGILLGARFVSRVREGNFARYSIADPRLFDLCKLMCARIEADAKRRMSDLT